MEKAGFTIVMKLQCVRSICIGGTLLVVLYAIVCTYMWATQRDHIFGPETILQTTPDRLGMKFEELNIPVGDGADRGELNAWWMPAGHDNAPTIIYLHGNYRNIGSNLEHALRLHGMGFNVFLPDYRGYGRSSGGRPDESKVYEDAEVAWQYLIKQRGLHPQRIFIYGHSLGGAIAIDLATHHAEAAGLIVESTFTSMADIASLSYPYLPVNWLLEQRFESLQKIALLKIPVLMIHGTWDKKIPVQMSRDLYDAAPQPKTIVLIAGGEHDNSSAVGWVEYRDSVAKFTDHYVH